MTRNQVRVTPDEGGDDRGTNTKKMIGPEGRLHGNFDILYVNLHTL